MEPNDRTTDSSPRQSDVALAAVAASPHPEWGDHEAHLRTRLDMGWIASTWVLCVAASLAAFAVGAFIVGSFTDTQVTDPSSTDLGVLTIVAVMSTFMAFVGVLVARLTLVEHDRLANSFAVAALHLVVAGAVFVVTLAIEGGISGQVDTAFSLLERSAAAAVLASLLAVGMVPARGGRPEGTQTGPTSQDYQL